MTTKQN